MGADGIIIEIFKGQDLVHPFKVFGFLAVQSKDLVLPGYPYGLIKADRLARVSESEKAYHRTRFLSRLPKEITEEMTDDVHEILDNVY